MSQSIAPDEFGDPSAVDLDAIASNLVERFAAYNDQMPQPGDVAGFSSEFFDAVYTMGVRYYANKQYDRAHSMFRMLCTLQPAEVRNFKAWGANYLGMRQYEQAVQAYGIAYTLSATDADTSFYLGQTFFFLKNLDEARGHLRFAREMAQRNPSLWPNIAEWSTQLLERIEARSRS